MSEITPALVSAARGHEEAAVTAVIAALTPLVRSVAYSESGGHPELAEDYAQRGSEIIWEVLPQATATTGGQLVNYLQKHLVRGVREYRRQALFPGESQYTVRMWQEALARAGGDPDAARALVSDREAMGGAKRTLSPTLARHMYEMTVRPPLSLDKPVEPGGGRGATSAGYKTLADTAAAQPPAPDSEPADSPRRTETTRRVRHILSLMPERRALILRTMTGVEPTPYPDDISDADLAAELGITAKGLSSMRGKAADQFRALWTTHYGAVA